MSPVLFCSFFLFSRDFTRSCKFRETAGAFGKTYEDSSSSTVFVGGLLVVSFLQKLPFSDGDLLYPGALSPSLTHVSAVPFSQLPFLSGWCAQRGCGGLSACAACLAEDKVKLVLIVFKYPTEALPVG